MKCQPILSSVQLRKSIFQIYYVNKDNCFAVTFKIKMSNVFNAILNETTLLFFHLNLQGTKLLALHFTRISRNVYFTLYIMTAKKFFISRLKFSNLTRKNSECKENPETFSTGIFSLTVYFVFVIRTNLYQKMWNFL